MTIQQLGTILILGWLVVAISVVRFASGGSK